MRLLITTTTVLAALGTASLARAQVATDLPDDARHAITLDAGLDSGMTSSAAYTYRLRWRHWDHDILLYGKLAFPAGGLDLADSAIETGLRTTVYGFGNLRLQLALGPVLLNTESNLFAANAFGVQGTLLPGYQSQRWGLMAELGYEKMLATNLRHSELYRDTYYPEAESGWYGDTAGTLRLGVRAGVRISEVHLSLRLGGIQTEGGKPHLPPFYGTLGVSYAF